MRDIKMTPVQSSQLAEIGYDEDSKTLAIRFNGRHDEPKGRLYHYSGVEPETFEALKNAESKGSFFIRNIKPNPGRYPYKKIDESAKDDEAERGDTTDSSENDASGGGPVAAAAAGGIEAQAETSDKALDDSEEGDEAART